MTSFRERNPVPIAVVGIVVLVALLFAAFQAPNLSVLGGGGPTYSAAFTEASNLASGDDVRVAGIKVGQVKGIKVDDGHVLVHFQVSSGTDLGSQSSADIKIKTLLGAMYLSVTSAGTGRLSKKAPIPLDRTTTPLTVTDAFEQLSGTLDSIDTTQVATAFDTLSADFKNTPDEVHATLVGLSALSQTIGSRNLALQSLLTHAQGVTTTLASRDAQVTRLIDDGDTVLQLVEQQRGVIHSLLIDATTLSQQVSGLVRENTAALAPALRNLGGTVDILSKDQANLDKGIDLLAPFVRDFTNTLGNGRWFDTFIQNVTDLVNPSCFTARLTVSGRASDIPLSGSGGCS